MAAEAQVDLMMGDFELLFQEQLVSLAEDLAEYQVVRKGKVVVTDPSPWKDHTSIMVLEEATAATPTKPDELITLQPEGGSRWFVQHMPHSGSAASGSTQINRQSNILPAGTSENTEEEAIAQTTAQIAVESAAPAVAAVAEQVEEIARTEVTHRGYRNTRVSMTILKHH